MANKYLDDFRTKYPMYKDMNDETLAKNIHQTFYKDINENEYMAKLGLYSDMSNDKKEENYTGKKKKKRIRKPLS
jgi:beta-galactosidase/beta-glucuronidase